MKSAEFKKIVSKELAPFLRENKWKGSGFNYTKQIGNIIRVITIQPSSAGLKFCIELGVDFDFLTVKNKTPNIKTWNTEIRTRLTPNNENDFWWNFPNDENNTKALFEELKQLISTIVDFFFIQYDDWENTIPTLSVQNIENGDTQKLFKLHPLRTALLFARINSYLNNAQKAIEFSRYGISKINGIKGSSLISDFEEIINKNS